jgi:hypothetical protein
MAVRFRRLTLTGALALTTLGAAVTTQAHFRLESPPSRKPFSTPATGASRWPGASTGCRRTRKQ